MIQLNLKSGVPICDQIVNGIIRLKALGVMQGDEQLPSVRALAIKLSVNPNTVQKAYQTLENSGIIYSVKGKGSFVSDTKLAAAQKRDEQQKELNVYVSKVLSTGITEQELADMLKFAVENAKKEGTI